MKERKLQLVESFCTQDESIRPKVFCKLVSGVLSKQGIQEEEEPYLFFSQLDSEVETV